MSERYSLIEDIIGYITNDEESKVDSRALIAPSQNVLIDREKRAGIRAGYTFALETGEGLYSTKSGKTWVNSSGTELPWKFNTDDTLNFFVQDVDGSTLDTWISVLAGLDSDYPLRATTWYNASEKIDEFLFVNHSTSYYHWSGAFAVVGSIPDATHITKAGTTTWAQNRFYTTGNKTMICVRTGTAYDYSAGENSTNLTVTDSSGLVPGDILYQEIVVLNDNPEAGYINDNIFQFQNNVCYSSDSDQRVFMAKNTDPTNFTPSSPRVAGEGNTFTLDDAGAKFGVVDGKLTMFAGDAAYIHTFQQQSLSASVTETILTVKKQLGVNQGAFSQETIVQTDSSLVYLSQEPALREVLTESSLGERNIKALSNPIKPDFDAETWTNAVAIWHSSRILLHSRMNSKTYILEYVETSDGGLRRYWQPPQVLPIGAFIPFAGYLYAGSSGSGNTMLLFNGASDYESGGQKTPINARMRLAYNGFGKRANLKNHDELFVTGGISANTNDLLVTLYYDYGGATQISEQFIDGSDQSILLESTESTSIGQQSLGHDPIAGQLSSPVSIAHFEDIKEYAPEDYSLLGIEFSTNELDRSWFITAVGPNVKMSNRKHR